MNELILTLRSYIILSFQDLANIKNTIQRRYQNLSSSERAQVLSMAVHNLLDKHLEGVNDEYRESLKLEILSKTLVNHVYDITRFDIFDSIIKLDLDQTTRLALAESWLSESVKVPVPRWALENYLMDEYEFSDLSIESNEPVPYNRLQMGAPILNFPKPLELNIHKSTQIRFSKSWKNRISYEAINRFIARNFAVIALVLILGLLTTFLLTWLTQPKEQKTVIVLSQTMDFHNYTGLSSLDKVYLINFDEELITKIDNDSKGTRLISLELKKEVHPFGLTSPMRFFRYVPFDYFKVKEYISNARNGLIGKSEHFNEVIYLSYLNDIDPLLLLAIIGQEQAFIPSDSLQSKEIINNPYNVYHSWTEYNTTLRDSTQIAINTIKNRLSHAPKNISPFIWLNDTYAEDPNWNNGVRLIYIHLLSIGRPD